MNAVLSMGKAHPTMHSEGFDEEASTCALMELRNCGWALFSFNPPQYTVWGDRAIETVQQPFMDHSVRTEDSNLANQGTRHCHNKFIHASKVRMSLLTLSLIVFVAKREPAPPLPHKKCPVGPAVVVAHRTVASKRGNQPLCAGSIAGGPPYWLCLDEELMRTVTACSNDSVALHFRETISVSCALLLPPPPPHTHCGLFIRGQWPLLPVTEPSTWQKCQTPHNDPHTDALWDPGVYF